MWFKEGSSAHPDPDSDPDPDPKLRGTVGSDTACVAHPPPAGGMEVVPVNVEEPWKGGAGDPDTPPWGAPEVEEALGPKEVVVGGVYSPAPIACATTCVAFELGAWRTNLAGKLCSQYALALAFPQARAALVCSSFHVSKLMLLTLLTCTPNARCTEAH